MRRAHATDVLLVSLGSTGGLRRADDELHDSLERAGARVAIARPHPQESLPTMMLTDLDAFRGLRALAQAETLTHAVCVAVRSDEAPPDLAREADLTVDGTGGVRELLEALL